jgi:hypothetical protein
MILIVTEIVIKWVYFILYKEVIIVEQTVNILWERVFIIYRIL